MPSSALLIPSSTTFHRALSSAPTKSPSVGPSLIICCSERWPCENTGFLTPARRVAVTAFIWWTSGGMASLFARPRLTGLAMPDGAAVDEPAAALTLPPPPPPPPKRVGDALRCSSLLCCDIRDDWAPWAAALAPSVCADCRRRRARWVRGEGGACSSVCISVVVGWCGGGCDGLLPVGGSRDGLGIMLVLRRRAWQPGSSRLGRNGRMQRLVV